MQQQPMRSVSADQLVQALTPIVTEASRIFDAGATMQSVLREAALAGFLMGRGASPTQAMETVMQWRMSGMAPSLARQMRGEASGPAPAMAPPTGGALPGGLTVPTPGAMEPDPAPRAMPAPIAGGAPLTPRERELLGAQIQQFLQSEANAGAMYEELMAQVPREDLKAYVRFALEDERKHYGMLSRLYRDLTGRTYEAKAQPTPFPDLLTGLKMAMDDEYEAFEQYRSVFLHYPNQQIRDIFFELMTDELEHATRFNYILQVLGQPG